MRRQPHKQIWSVALASRALNVTKWPGGTALQVVFPAMFGASSSVACAVVLAGSVLSWTAGFGHAYSSCFRAFEKSSQCRTAFQFKQVAGISLPRLSRNSAQRSSFALGVGRQVLWSHSAQMVNSTNEFCKLISPVWRRLANIDLGLTSRKMQR